MVLAIIVLQIPGAGNSSLQVLSPPSVGQMRCAKACPHSRKDQLPKNGDISVSRFIHQITL